MVRPRMFDPSKSYRGWPDPCKRRVLPDARIGGLVPVCATGHVADQARFASTARQKRIKFGDNAAELSRIVAFTYIKEWGLEMGRYSRGWDGPSYKFAYSWSKKSEKSCKRDPEPEPEPECFVFKSSDHGGGRDKWDWKSKYDWKSKWDCDPKPKDCDPPKKDPCQTNDHDPGGADEINIIQDVQQDVLEFV